jgi:hypothetical protein
MAQGVLDIQVVNGYNLIVDSNVQSPPTYAPRAAFIGAQFCNIGTAPLTNVTAHTGNYDVGRSLTVGTTSASTTVTSAALFAATDVGQSISGPGIPAGATITVFTNASTITISSAATATGSITARLDRRIVVTTTSGSKTVTSAALFLATDAGLRISGTGIPAGATITSFNSTSSVTISAAATASGSPTARLYNAAGTFPVKTFGTDLVRPHVSGTGDYSLKLEVGTGTIEDATRYIGTLAVNECRIQYWLFSYPACVNQGTPRVGDEPPCTATITGGVGPEDDVTLDYDLWATADSVANKSVTRSFTMRNEISAAANKIWPNTTSKVPDEYLSAIQDVIGWGTIGPDGQPLTDTTAIYPGQRVITTQGIWYDLGNVGHGFDNNGDLIPDQNAWMQPVGDAGVFDSACFRMINVYGIVIVKLKTGGELLIPMQNLLYHENLPENTGVVGLIYYQFVATKEGCSSSMTPYQEAASGFDNEKFAGDYGLNLGLVSGAFDTDLSFTKTDNASTTTAPSTLSYVLSLTNKTGVPLGAPELGTPLVLRETIPTGTTFVAGSADDSPNTNLDEPTGSGSYVQGYTDIDGDLQYCRVDYQFTSPGTPASYTLFYSTDNGVTWSLTEPSSGVTDIRWMLQATIALDGGPANRVCTAPNGVFDNGTLQVSIPSDSVLAGTTSGSSTVTAIKGVFFASDVGKGISGVGIPSGATIATFVDAATVTISANATATTTTGVVAAIARTGSTLAVRFQVSVNTAGTTSPVICNTGYVGFGPVQSNTTASDCTLVTGNNNISGVVWEDDGGTGGTHGNGIIDNSTEVGIGAGARVDLYYDANADGEVDSADLLYSTATTSDRRTFNVGTTITSATVTSAALFTANDVGSRIYGTGIPAGAYIVSFTNASTVTISANATATATVAGTLTGGAYNFRNVPDGNFIAVVKKYDGASLAVSTTASSTTLTSAGLFQASDVGRSISGSGIPLGATVTAFTSASSVTISSAATATGSTTAVFDRLAGGVSSLTTTTTASSTTVTSSALFLPTDVGRPIWGPGIPSGATITAYTDASTVTISSAATAASTTTRYIARSGATPTAFTVGTTNASTTVTSAALFLATDVGRPISGTGIPAGASITAFTNTSTVTISAAATATASVTGYVGRSGLTVVTTNASTTVTSAGLFLSTDVGKAISGTNIPVGSTITAFTDASTVTISAAATASGTTYATVSRTAVNDFLASRAPADANTTSGWGNTTYDPNVALTTDSGILKMNEELGFASLAISIDLDHSNASDQAATTTELRQINFGFAPPFQITKTTLATTVDEGDTFDYTIVLENRLPSVGVQGPTGCQYTAWATTGTNGNTSTKEFNPANFTFAWDGPNRKVATAVVTGGGNREITGTGFRLAAQAGSITRVEALFMGYYNVALDDDYLSLKMQYNSGGYGALDSIPTGAIDSFIGPPATLDPNSAISWDVTSQRAWSMSDNFALAEFYINPKKAAGADGKIFSLDAIGIRVTTNADCEAGPSTTLTPVPLQDRFDSTTMSFVSAVPAPTSVSGSTIQWDDVGPIVPGTSNTVTVTMRAADVAGLLTGSCAATSAPSTPPPSNSACNLVETAYGTKNVYYADGRKANDDDDKVAINIQGKGELRGTVFRDGDNDGWAMEVAGTDPRLANVSVTLFGCIKADLVTMETGTSNSKDCSAMTGGNTWIVMSTTTTASDGTYQFIGLDSGYYIIQVGDTDGAVTTAGTSPFGFTQTAEPLDVQTTAVSPPNADGADCGTCNNTWGTSTANLRSDQTTINFLNGASEETINGIDFGYFSTQALIYGNIYHDKDGDGAVREPEDTDLDDFTVRLYTDPNGDGDPADGVLQSTTTSDSNGDYSFTVNPGVSTNYTIVVTPETLPNNVWAETRETTGGTGSLDNRIPITVAPGATSGSHDFGYTLTTTSTIGDTVFLDFDGDGVQDTTEEGIPNITVWLYEDLDRDGSIDPGIDLLLQTDITDSTGKYLFTGLGEGSYIVVVDTSDSDFPSDTTQTADPDIYSGTIGDKLWLDADGDAVFDTGEGGVVGTTVLLWSDNGNGTFSSSTDTLVAATVTNVNGNYLFTGLPAGSYFIQVDETTLPYSALVRTTADPTATLITLASNSASYLTADAGYSPSSNSAIGDRVWHDVDGDGVQDAGEVGIAGVDITVTGTGCAPCTATTNASGFWYVPGLTLNAVYTIAIDTADLPRNFVATNAPIGSRAISVTRTASSTTLTSAGLFTALDLGRPVTVTGIPAGAYITEVIDANTVTISAAATTSGTASTTLAATRTAGTFDNMNVDFGYNFSPTATGTISGSVFLDADGDEALDSGEEMNGITVNLLDSDGYVVATTTTSSGTYSFPGAFIGNYSIEALASFGTRYSTVFLSSTTGFPNLNVIYDSTIYTTADDQSSVSVDGVHSNLLQDFGYKRYLGSVGDTVYWDANENGTQDLGEPGFSGVTVRLFDCTWTDDGDGAFEGATEATGCVSVGTTTTTADDTTTGSDESGKYLFANLDDLAANHYYVIEVDTTATGGLPGAANFGLKSNPLATIWLTADPETDGAVCSDLTGSTDPQVTVCESQNMVQVFRNGLNYTGGDFGYQLRSLANYAKIGDTVWVDTNADGLKDATEPGIQGVTVWIDANGDGVLDGPKTLTVGTTNASTTVTSAALFTAADVGRTISGAGIPSGATVTGFTNASTITISAAATATGSATASFGARTFTVGTTNGSATVTSAALFTSADVGRLISGTGIPAGAYISAFTNASSVTISANATATGSVTAAIEERTAETDFDGYYLFTGLPNGTFSVNVFTSDADWPAGLSTTPRFQVNCPNTPGGDFPTTGTPCTADTTTSTPNVASVIVTSGAVSTIDDGIAGTTDDTCTSCDLSVDFGYRYVATGKLLRGTICVESDLTGSSLYGNCGDTATDYFGVSTTEVALAGIAVSLYQWTDAGTANCAWTETSPACISGTRGTLDPSDTFTFLGSTNTTVDGDFTFTNVPDNVVVVFGVNATQNLKINTNNTGTSTTGLTSVEGTGVLSRQLYDGYVDTDNDGVHDTTEVTTVVRQALFLGTTTPVQDLDFAFDSTLGGTILKDFGDLPDTAGVAGNSTSNYNATLLTNGASHKVRPTYTIGTTDGSTTVTSASFASTDVGSPIVGAGIPTGATITAVTPGVSATISYAATATAPTVTARLGWFLGTTVTSETNGQPSATAVADTDEGVTLIAERSGVNVIVPGDYTDCTVDNVCKGGLAAITASGEGWIVGWMDFNQDGDFADSGEQVMNQPFVRMNGTTATASLTRTGTVATVTVVGHNLSTGQIVTISGATSDTTLWNGTFTITVTGPDTFTYTMSGTPSTSSPTGTTVFATDLGLAQMVPFNVPDDPTLLTQWGANPVFFARFRLYPSEPTLASATGAAMDSSFQAVQGEVEDYQFMTTLAVTRAKVTAFVARDMGGSVALEWETTSEMGTVGFFLNRWDEQQQAFVRVNEKLIPSLLTPHGGLYRYIDPRAAVGQNYRYQLIEVEASGKKETKGPYDVNTTVTMEADAAFKREQSIEPDPRPTGFAMAARVGRIRAEQTGDARRSSELRNSTRAAAGAKISVTESGIHYVSLQDIQTRAGFTVDRTWLTSSKNLYSLTNRGEIVPFASSADNSGLLFYGQALNSNYARDNVYWLGPSERNSPRMKERKDLPIRPPTGSESFMRTLHLEKDEVPAPGLFTDASKDFWFWNYAYAGAGPISFTFRTDGAKRSGSASVVIRLKGGSDTETDPDHHAVVRLNGQDLGEMTWDGLQDIERTIEFSASLLVDGENILELDNVLDTGALYSLIYLDSFDVRFESLYRAVSNRAEVSTAANASVLISGFTRSDVMVFDVTNPKEPVRVMASLVQQPGGRYGVALSPKTADTVYHAVAGDAMRAASGIVKDVASTLKTRNNRGEYIIVTNQELSDAARGLADYRSDLTSKVVDIEDVYDEFNFGIPDPHALRTFLGYAYSEWTQRPKYVLLGGDGTWDYKNSLGLGNGVIQPMMISTPTGVFPSDVWFANVEKGPAPEMAIGRLPASTPEELTQMITKIQIREGGSGAWMNRALMAADRPDDAGEFTVSSVQITGSLPSGSLVTPISVAELGGDEARTQFINGINEGVGMINYIGHGGYWLLSNEGMFWSGDEQLLTNSAQTPVMTAMTCLVGNFGLPWVPSVGELLVLKADGGVSALWAPTGESENELAVPLAEGFYSSSSIAGPRTRIGDAIMASMKAYELTRSADYMLGIYTLLGDPAMRLR